MNASLRKDADQIIRESLAAVLPDEAVRRALQDYHAGTGRTVLTAIMALIYTLLGKLSLVWPAALHVYFDLFSGAIQTYVFCMLTMTYIQDACSTDEA